MGDILRRMGCGSFLVDGSQLRPESSRFPLLLIGHPSMEPSQRQEKQHEAEEDQAGEESANAEDLRRRGRPGRTGEDQKEQADEYEIAEGEGERQGAERLQPEERVFVVRP